MALGSGRKERRALSDINVTPLVDVMLVLLIIFMVTAPLLQQGLDVNLPRVKGKGIEAKEDQIVLTITKDRKVWLNSHSFTISKLGEKLKAIFKERGGDNKVVFLRADKDVPYGVVVETMAVIRESGIERLAMITEPAELDGF